jgi:hypothetical protein
MSTRRTFLALLTAAPIALLARARGERGETSPEPRPTPPRAALAPWEGEPDLLARWRRAPRRLVLESAEPVAASLLAAIRAGETVEIIYDGGATPFTRRSVAPGALFEVEGFPGLYLSGYCHHRAAERTFLLSRLRLAP